MWDKNKQKLYLLTLALTFLPDPVTLTFELCLLSYKTWHKTGSVSRQILQLPSRPHNLIDPITDQYKNLQSIKY